MVPEAKSAGTTTEDIFEKKEDEIWVTVGTTEQKMESGGFVCIRSSPTIEATS